MENKQGENKDYVTVMSEILVCLKDELPTLKNYFFLKLQSTNAHFQPLLVYEEGCYVQPIRRRINEKYCNCICVTIKEFKDRLTSNEFSGNSYIALLLVSTKVNGKEKIKERAGELDIIFKKYNEVYQLSPKKASVDCANDILIDNDVTSLIEEISYVTSSFLTNAELSNDEEKIIKRLFKDAESPVLEYKVLKGGKSGSKVIEIRPKKGYATNLTKRYIVKFSKHDDKRKISIEALRFGCHIEHFFSGSYTRSYERNATTEAIKYIYASGNNITNSYSFAEVLKNGENEFHDGRKEIIEEIFKTDLFVLWQQSKEDEKNKVKDLYNDYIDPDSFFAHLKKIKGIDDTQLREEKIYKAFNKIWDQEIDTVVKVCHGDLHSENLFKDSEGVYLIDFGFTDRRHAIIDHTSLECSIKFKHVPYYIEQSILEDIEQQLLSDDSFVDSFEVNTNRKDIVDYYDLIKDIRKYSLPYLYKGDAKLEYLISLFILTCRNAQYPDLNQLYALKSGEILADKLLQLS